MRLGTRRVNAPLADCVCTLSLILSLQLNSLDLGDDMARGQGISVEFGTLSKGLDNSIHHAR